MNTYRATCAAIVFCAGSLWLMAGPAVGQETPARKPKTDLGSFVKEIMVLKLEGSQTQLAMWFPFDFFVEANMAGAAKNRADVENQLKFLKPYHTIIVQCGTDRDDGSTAYAGQKEVRARAVLKLDSGEEIQPLDKVPPLVSAAIEAMKKLMASEGDEGGANMHMLLFPATKDGKPLIDTAKKGKLTLVLKADKRTPEFVAVWRTPFDATTPVPPCKKCKEPISAKWLHCPWCGANLDAPKK